MLTFTFHLSILIGCFLMFVVLFFEDTWFLLNLFVQSCGYYLQWIVQLGFHTDAFAMQNDAPDGKSAPNWMNDWTIFYCTLVKQFQSLCWIPVFIEI